MRYFRGDAKPYESLTPDDYDFFPIWVMAIDEEGEPGQDETWRKPLWGAKNVEKDMVAVFVPFDVCGTDLFGVGLYSTTFHDPSLPETPRDQLDDIAIWWKGRWVWIGGDEGPHLEWPLKVRVRPTIEGEAGVCFLVANEVSVTGVRCSSDTNN